MSQTYFTTIRLSHETWKRINREREPKENFNDTLCRMLEERERLRVYAKGVVKDIA